MYSKHNEVEAVIEDLIENNIMDSFRDMFSNARECEVALEMLQTKLDEFDTAVFKDLFD